MQRRRLSFDDFELSPELRRLTRDGDPIAVEPRVFDLLVVLVRERDRIVTKQELFDEVWSGVVVAPGALDRAIHEARRALGDRGDRQTHIQTVRGRGFRFVASVREEFDRADPNAAPLFGRDSELAEMTELLSHGRPAIRIAAIEGEAGIGKTALALRIAKRADESGRAVRSGRCSATEGSPPFWLWIQLIAGASGRADATTNSSFGRSDDIGALVGAPPLGEPGEFGDRNRFWLFDSIERHFRTAVREPQLWLLDDLQWADEASLHLLVHLAGASFDHPVFILATFREEGVGHDHPIRKALERCGNRVPVDRIRLRGLDVAALRLLGLHLTGETPPEGAIERLRERTGGNPFLATESLLRAERSGSEATSPPADRLLRAPSSSSSSLVRSRLDLVDEALLRLLVAASVIGRRFDSDRLALVVQQDESNVRARLADAVSAGILVDEAEANSIGRFEFRHDLLRESLYASLSAEDRTSIHRRVGEAIESLYGTRSDARIAELAFHFREAASFDVDQRAIDYAIRAGESARARFGFEQASDHFENALVALERESTKTRRRQARILLSLADSARRAGDRSRAHDALHRAAQLGRELDDPGILVDAAFAMQLALSPIEVSPTEVRDIELLRSALRQVPEENRAVRARLLSRLSTALYWRPIHVHPVRYDVARPKLDEIESEAFGWDRESGRRIADDAIAAAREAGDPTTLAYGLSAQYIAQSRTRRSEGRPAIATEIARLAMAGDDWDLRLVGQGMLLTESAQAGDVTGARDAAEAMNGIAERLRHPQSRWHASLGGVLVEMMLGRLGPAEEFATKTHRRMRGDVNLSVEDCFIQQRFSIYRFQRRISELEDPLRMAVERYDEMSNHMLMLAMIELERGREREAKRILDWACANEFEEIGEDMLSLFTLMLAAEVCASVGSRDQARGLYERLIPHRGRCVTINFVTFDGPVDRALGLLANRLGDSGSASAHLEAAIDLLRRMGSPAWLAQCLGDAAVIGSGTDPRSRTDRWRDCGRESRALVRQHGFVLFGHRTGPVRKRDRTTGVIRGARLLERRELPRSR